MASINVAIAVIHIELYPKIALKKYPETSTIDMKLATIIAPKIE